MNLTADTSIANYMLAEIRDSVNKVVEEAIERLPKQKLFNPNDWVKGKAEACRVLNNISPTTLDSWINRGIIDDCIATDGGVYFFNIPGIYEALKYQPKRKPRAVARRR